MKKTIITLILVLACTISLMASDDVKHGVKITMNESLKLLKEGNERFASGKAQHPHQDKTQLEKTTKEGQHPFATILTCSDSRVPVENIFDRGVGDIFVIRVAGNVSGVNVIATAEYASEHLHTPVMVILGHTHCGAVTACASHAKEHGALPFLLHKIDKAVERARAKYPDMKGQEFVEKCIEENVYVTMEDFLALSPAIQKKVKERKMKLIGAIYDIETGKIRWLEESPIK